MKRCISAAIEESANLFCPSCQNLFQRKTVASGSGFALNVAFIRNHVLANDPTFASGFGESSGGRSILLDIPSSQCPENQIGFGGKNLIEAKGQNVRVKPDHSLVVKLNPATGLLRQGDGQ